MPQPLRERLTRLRRTWLQHKVVVITGAAGGLGRVLAHTVAAEGATVVCIDLSIDGLNELKDSLESQFDVPVFVYVLDITNAQACYDTAQQIYDRAGRIDVLVHNAGITHLSALHETQTSTLRKVMDVNFWGAVYLTQAFLPELRANHGHIIALSSVAGYAPLIRRTGYAASKHAMHGFFGSLRAEEPEIDISIVCPSFISTNVGQSASNDGTARPGSADDTTGKQLTPEQVAQTLVDVMYKRPAFVPIGGVSHFSWRLVRAAPRLYDAIMKRSITTDESN